MRNNKDMQYNIAMQCARLNDEGCVCDCAQCQFNIFNYVEDVREASLLKANAYTDYHNNQSIITRYKAEYESQQTANSLIAGIFLAINVCLFSWGCSACKSCVAPSNEKPVTVETLPTPSPAPTPVEKIQVSDNSKRKVEPSVKVEALNFVDAGKENLRRKTYV